MRTLNAIVILFVVTLLPATLPGQTQPSDPEKEKAVTELEALLMAPCCYGGPINQHTSGVATEMKSDVRKMIYSGKTRDDVLAFYTEKYGKRIIAEPETSGFNLLAWLLPPVVVLFGGFLTYVVMRKSTRNKKPELTKQHENGDSGADSKWDSVIEDELKQIKD